MARAVWNGAVIAQSNDTIVVEGNHYFPPQSVDSACLRPSTTHTVHASSSARELVLITRDTGRVACCVFIFTAARLFQGHSSRVQAGAIERNSRQVGRKFRRPPAQG